MKHVLNTILLSTVALVGGCATDTPILDAALGKSAAQMIAAQTYDTTAAANPPALLPESGDGQRLKNAVDANRKDVGKGVAEVARPIVFEVGQGGR